jgi:hypothetical protein
MSDIVERLRVGTTCSDEEMNKRHEAADEIEKLRAALRKLYDHEGERVLNSIGVECYTVELEDALCEARAALGETE